MFFKWQSHEKLVCSSVADPECFMQDPDLTIFSSRIPTFFNPGSLIKSGIQTYFFLASYAFRNKVLVLVIVKEIRNPRSGIRTKFIPDPGGKKTLDPGSGSTTLS
jgi:hypothetical protein